MSLAGAYRVMLSELPSVGLDPATVCREAGIDPRALDDGAAFDVAQATAILAQAEAMAADPLLGLHLAERALGHGILSYLARSQRTVGDGLEAFQRYAGVAWGKPDAITIDRRDAHACVVLNLSELTPRHAVEYVAARTAISLRRSRAEPTEVAFAHAAGGDAAEYGRVLRAPVRFRRPETLIAIRAADLARPLRSANPEAAAALAGAMAHAPVRPAATVAAQLAVAVERALARGTRPDREALARALGMSGRTLARRLVAERRLFRDVVDDVRRTIAQRLVADDRSMDLGEVAARVGFADPAAFGKAFRRWFGTSPSAFRARRTSA